MRNIVSSLVRSYFLYIFTLALVSAALWAAVYPAAQRVSAAGSAPAANLFSGCGGVYLLPVNEAYEQRVVELVNQERARVGLSPLKRVKALDDAARYHAVDMAQDDYFDHQTFDRQDERLVQVCDVWTRIKNYYSSPRAENIAAGYRTPEDVMAGWMASEGHKANILGASWEIGVGYFEGGGGYQRYWVQDFGKRSGQYPLILNGEAARAADPLVEVYIYGDWEEMRLKVNDGAWSAWQPFQNTFNWTLAEQAGLQTLSAELRSSGRTNVISEDQVILEISGTITSGQGQLYLPVIRH